MAKSKKAFSLIEVIAAVALLALGGFAISQACYNMMLPMTMKEKDSLENANLQLCYDAILNVSDYEALDDGIDVDTIDNQTYRVYADFEQTQILDLFELRVRITSPQKEYNKTFLVIRPQWYENTTDRDNLKDDRIDYLEQKRRNDYFSREKK
ncbi:MAG: prepilin-type N-terminal cleavage/methylation domain-containing protein [Verrucomicrobiaceae bacterium]|jgi:prepilin-type N-terminal cleavage/methylation domain-containing protein|nr:prepilin-type N-terminal cleavage/methylation domain-containing protein [Verrucomicrobiaceae bacterium]